MDDVRQYCVPPPTDCRRVAVGWCWAAGYEYTFSKGDRGGASPLRREPCKKWMRTGDVSAAAVGPCLRQAAAGSVGLPRLRGGLSLIWFVRQILPLMCPAGPSASSPPRTGSSLPRRCDYWDTSSSRFPFANLLPC